MMARWLLKNGARLHGVYDSQPEMWGLDLPPDWDIGSFIAMPGPLEVGELKISLAVVLVFPSAALKDIRKQLARA